ncbi:MAG: cytochrome c biogenesis protein CcsA [Planctomycetota bacterium]|nr:cytochrome c biogenesis protein CcsA [Planctomycetota bacterium]
MNPIQSLFDGDVALSTRLTSIADVLCIVGVLVCAVSAFMRKADGQKAALVSRLPILVLVGTFATMVTVVAARWKEVNHFPSQTMSEVLTMFSFALVAAMVVLHVALDLKKRGGGWAVLDDVLVLLVFAGVFATHAWIRGLSTAQRDLPPALQSYWFPFHLTALIFSYATMAIAAFVCLLYFVTRFWSGVFLGGQSKKTQWITLAALTLVPFVHIVTLPILAISGLVFWLVVKTGKMPRGEQLVALEKSFDDVSFKTFAVGFPFLTAGLWMGAFWAQEAWANYWGWDSKENSALITWLVYVLYIHLRMLGGYRGSKAMSVLVAGAASVFLTFQLFGYMPDSQKSLHRYTDDGVQPQEGQMGPAPTKSDDQARVEPAAK